MRASTFMATSSEQVRLVSASATFVAMLSAAWSIVARMALIDSVWAVMVSAWVVIVLACMLIAETCAEDNDVDVEGAVFGADSLSCCRAELT